MAQQLRENSGLIPVPTPSSLPITPAPGMLLASAGAQTHTHILTHKIFYLYVWL